MQLKRGCRRFSREEAELIKSDLSYSRCYDRDENGYMTNGPFIKAFIRAEAFFDYLKLTLENDTEYTVLETILSLQCTQCSGESCFLYQCGKENVLEFLTDKRNVLAVRPSFATDCIDRYNFNYSRFETIKNCFDLVICLI
ncbi:hypothetical protein L596_026051 [Steinernema carpocapsae]|uniref:Uncharacterized protein n=1 Tax=Steinernema carpocapsae TaxID=34508 RepID=A0A4U5M064_STECR|nr:hypothetical protein L596_026051 [Steinernema carpocapsae]